MAKSAEAFRTISEVSDILETPAHVLRFWESQFSQVRPLKRAGGRRYYRPQDVALLGGIRKLLHDDGVTIRGVQKILREQGARQVATLSGLAEDGALVGEALSGAAAEAARPAPVPETPPAPLQAGPEAPADTAAAEAPPVAVPPAVAEDTREPFLPFLAFPAPARPAPAPAASPVPEAPMMVDAPSLPQAGAATVTSLRGGDPDADEPVSIRLRHVDIVRAGARRQQFMAVYLRLKALRDRRLAGQSGAQP